MKLTYTQYGDYLIPNLVLSDTREYHIAEAINLSKARQAQCFPGFGGFFITEENGTDCSSQRAYSTESSVGKPFLSRASSVCQMSFPRWMENRIRASRGTLGYSSL